MSDNLYSENRNLRLQLKAYITQARENEIKLRRFQDLQLQLIATDNLPDLLYSITHTYKSEAALDSVTLLLIDSDHEIRHLLAGLEIHCEPKSTLLFLSDPLTLNSLFDHPPQVLLGPCPDEYKQLLFPKDANRLTSCAILPLIRQQKLIGVLNLGSSDPHRYLRGTSTDFLEGLAAILAICVESALNSERLKLLGITDPLTGLHNRRYFDERLNEELYRAQRELQPLSCLLLDIDHFKNINDRYGHPTGDEILRSIAMLIKQHMRSSDVLARYGGEEFAIVLTHTDEDLALDIGNRIRRAIAATKFNTLTGQSLQTSVSIGCTSQKIPQQDIADHKLPMQIIAAADQALYEAKHKGRNCIVSRPLPTTSSLTDTEIY